MEEKKQRKNIKISEKHHQMIKSFCDKNGTKIHKMVEKWIEQFCKNKIDIYGDDD